MQNLKSKTKKSGLWVVGSNFGKQAFQIGTTAILARLILPNSFGVFATFLIIISICRTFIEPFVNKNLILEQEKEELVSTSVLVSFFHGVLLMIFCVWSADFFSNYFNQPQLKDLLLYGSMVLVTSALANPFMSILEKRLSFKWISITNIVATVLGKGLLTIIFAWYNFEFWALLIGLIAFDLIRILMFLVKLLPTFVKPTLISVKRIYQDSFEMITEGIANRAALKGDYFVISKMLGAEALGFYEKAYKLMALPTNLIGQAFQKVAFPAMTSVRGDKEKMKKFYLRSLYLAALLLFPLTIVLYYLADIIVDIFLGAQWGAVVVPFQILALSLYFRFAYKIAATLMYVYREFRLYLFFQIIYAGLIIISAFYLSEFGIIGVASGISISIFANYIILHGRIMKRLDVTISDHLNEFKHPLFIALICFIPLFILESSSIAYSSILQVIATTLILLTLVFLFWKQNRFFFGENGIWWYRYVFEK